jgi:tetratricopeptide (TPR) repeat protein
MLGRIDNTMAQEYELQTKRIDLAHHYLRKLTTASVAYRRGHENTAYALTLFDQEWLQIKYWWQWVNLHTHLDDVTQLGVGYGLEGEELFNLRQTPQERLEWVKIGLAASQKTRNQQAEMICLFRMAWAVHKQSRLAEAEATAQSALTLAESIGDLLYIGRILNLLGDIWIRRGDYSQAWDLCSRSFNLLLNIEAETYLSDTYFALSEIAYLQGNFVDARQYALQSVRILEERGLEGSYGLMYNWVGLLSCEIGDYELGEQYLLQSIEDSRIKGFPITVAHGLGALGIVRVARQNYHEAKQCFEESILIAQSIGEDWLIPRIESEKGNLLYLMGDWQAAEEILKRTVDYGRTSGYRGVLVHNLHYLAEVQVGSAQLDLAYSTLAEGLQIAYKDGNKIEIARGLLVAAKFALQCGKTEQAAAWLGLLLSQSNVIARLVDAGWRFYTVIEKEVGKALLEVAFQRGKNLDLDTEIEFILSELW